MTLVKLRSRAKDFDFAPFPNSWFQVAWSHELPRRGVLPVSALGRELVLFRGEDGQARALDAYCSHLGAHLGVGGTVEGNEIRCPFHGWRFDGAGACTSIPCATKIPARATMRAWSVREMDGLLFVWHDAAGREPWFEVPRAPELDSSEWSRPRFVARTIRTRWRELCENAVDRLHFHALHEYPEPPVLDFKTDGPRYSMRSSVRWKMLGRVHDMRLDIDAHGAGFAITRGRHPLAPFVVVSSTVPIDESTIVQRMTFAVSKKIPFPLRALARRVVIDAAMREFSRDVPIWENKICVERPVLCEADGPIPRFRKWARQFEPLAT